MVGIERSPTLADQDGTNELANNDPTVIAVVSSAPFKLGRNAQPRACASACGCKQLVDVELAQLVGRSFVADTHRNNIIGVSVRRRAS
jgi:hypothetical protein